MNYDYQLMPLEIYTDTLEDKGQDASELRQCLGAIDIITNNYSVSSLYCKYPKVNETDHISDYRQMERMAVGVSGLSINSYSSSTREIAYGYYDEDDYFVNRMYEIEQLGIQN